MPSCDGANCSACNCSSNCGSDITMDDVRRAIRSELSELFPLTQREKELESTPKEKELETEIVRLKNELILLRGKIKEEANKEVMKRLTYLAEQEGVDLNLLIPTLKEKTSTEKVEPVSNQDGVNP